MSSFSNKLLSSIKRSWISGSIGSLFSLIWSNKSVISFFSLSTDTLKSTLLNSNAVSKKSLLSSRVSTSIYSAVFGTNSSYSSPFILVEIYPFSSLRFSVSTWISSFSVSRKSFIFYCCFISFSFFLGLFAKMKLFNLRFISVERSVKAWYLR